MKKPPGQVDFVEFNVLVPVTQPPSHPEAIAVWKHLPWDVACACVVGLVTVACCFDFTVSVWYTLSLAHFPPLPKNAFTTPSVEENEF